MTFDNRRSRDAEDRLNEVWDDVIGSGSEGPHALTGDDAANAAFASYLDQLAPSLNPSARERMRARVLASQRGEAERMEPQNAQVFGSGSGDLIASLPQQPRPIARRRGHLLHHPVMQIAATILLMVGMVGSWLVIRGTGGPNPSTPQFAASSPSPGQTMPAGSGEGAGLITLEIDRFGEDHTLYATMRRITLEPGALWDFDNGPLGLQSNLAGRYLESGSITLSGPDGELAFESGQPFNLSRMRPAGFMSAIQNPGREPAIILELLVHGEGEALPEPPMGSTMDLIGSTPIQQPAGAITHVNLMRMTVNGEGSPAVKVSGSQQTVFIAVEAGTMAMEPRPGMFFSIGTIGEAAPVASPAIPAGETWAITLGAGKTVQGDSLADVVSIADDQPLTTLTLTVKHDSPADVAQDRIVSDPVRWDMAGAANQATLSLRTITLEPGSAWTREQTGITHLWVQSGELSLSLTSGESPTMLQAGMTAGKSGGGPITLANDGNETVELIEGVIVAGPPESPLISDLPNGVIVSVLVTGVVSVSGTVETMLYTDSAQSGQGGGEYVLNGARLASIIEGSIQIARLGGQIDILRGVTPGAPATQETVETLGEPVMLQTGDAFVAHPGSGFSVGAAGEGSNQIVVLAISSATGEDQPTASPVSHADSASSQMIEVTPGDCMIEARTTEEFESILADPFAEGTPQAGMREQASTGIPADLETIHGVTDTVRQIVACNAPGTHLEMYSLYSSNMLRFHAAAGSLTIDDISGLDQLEPSESTSPMSGYIAVENVVVFADGRVEARVNANGEIAYLTFVYEEGRWLIDFWDDEIPDAAATPAA